MITIYINGCSTCGVNASYIRRIKRWADTNQEKVDVINSKYDIDRRQEHLELVNQLSGVADAYTPIVVHGDNIYKLREWNL